MASSVQFADGMKRLINSSVHPSSSVSLDDFPLLGQDPSKISRASSFEISSRAQSSDFGVSSFVTTHSSPCSHWSSFVSSAEVKLQFVAPIVKDCKKFAAISKSI